MLQEKLELYIGKVVVENMALRDQLEQVIEENKTLKKEPDKKEKK